MLINLQHLSWFSLIPHIRIFINTSHMLIHDTTKIIKISYATSSKLKIPYLNTTVLLCAAIIYVLPIILYNNHNISRSCYRWQHFLFWHLFLQTPSRAGNSRRVSPFALSVYFMTQHSILITVSFSTFFFQNILSFCLVKLNNKKWLWIICPNTSLQCWTSW